MNRKRVWELASGAALILVVGVALGGYFGHREQKRQVDLAMDRGLDSGDIETVRRLVSKGASVRERPLGAGRASPLFTAAAHNDVALAKEVLARGAQINARDNIGFTAVTWAAADGNADVLSVLLDA